MRLVEVERILFVRESSISGVSMLRINKVLGTRTQAFVELTTAVTVDHNKNKDK